MGTSLVASPMTEREFGILFSRLVMQGFRGREMDVLTIRAYYEEMRDLPLDAVDRGAKLWAKRPDEQWFPSAAQWRTLTVEAQGQLLREVLTVGREAPWTFECEDCQDIGWICGLECDGGRELWPEDEPARAVMAGRPQFRNKACDEPWAYRKQDRRTVTPQRPTCGREKAHLPHSYTMACPCRQTNRTYQRHRQLGSGE